MKTGKSYWALTVNDRKVRKQLVSDPTVKNVLSNVKAIRIAMKFQLDNKTEYATESEAEIAFNKLDEVTRRYVMICETIPVSLGLGWC
jgi:hypothetical protein